MKILVNKMNHFLVVVLILFTIQYAFAKEFPVAARLFVGNQKITPTNLNNEMTAQSLEKFDDLNQFGAEATYPIFKFFEGGFRYTKRMSRREEAVSNPSTDYWGEIKQDSVSVIARVPFIKTQFLRADFFGSVGGTNTTFQIKTATQDGELSRKKSDGWFGAPITSFGGSLGLGFKGFYLVMEAGIETNKIDKLARSGNINTNVTEIDLSGSYFSLGLMFDGVKATSK